MSTLPVAINRRYKSQDGEWRSEATYVNVVAWDKLAERAGQMAKKGAAVMVEGRLQSRRLRKARRSMSPSMRNQRTWRTPRGRIISPSSPKGWRKQGAKAEGR